MLIVILGIVGGILGAASMGDDGILLGILLGALTGSHLGSRQQIRQLQDQIKRLSQASRPTQTIDTAEQSERLESESEVIDSDAESGVPESVSAMASNLKLPQISQPAEPEEQDLDSSELLTEYRQYDERGSTVTELDHSRDEDDAPVENQTEAGAADSSEFGNPFDSLRQWLSNINPFVMIGVLVTFIGLALLVKYAADKDLFPIEVRLAGVGLFGLAMILIGYRLRHRQFSYGLVLQGGGFGVIYLTLYAAAKYYALITLTIALGLMLLVVLIAVIMAILQNARFLAVFASIGGFLTPVLTSDGSGRIELLLSYYLLLNIGILSLALFKSWRLLNWVGFVMTFGICLAWGLEYYTTEHYQLCQWFLIAYFAIYLFISIRFALSQPPNLRGLMDGSLIFGLPAIVFLIQNHIVDHLKFGPAVGALLLGCVYLILSRLVERKSDDQLKNLRDAFLAIGLVAGSLSVPLAFNDQWTSVIWSLEACGLLWLGIRQNQLLVRCLAFLLMAVAHLINLPSLDSWSSVTSLLDSDMTLINRNVLAAVILAVASFIAARLAERAQILKQLETYLITPLLIAAFFWLWISLLLESESWLANAVWVKVTVAGSALLGLTWLIISLKLDWSRMQRVLMVYAPVLFLCLINEIAATGDLFYFSNYGLIAWLLAWLVHFSILKSAASSWPQGLTTAWHLLGYWQILFVLMCGSLRFLSETTLDPDTLMMFAAILLPASGVFWCVWPRGSTLWPVRSHNRIYQFFAQLPVLAVIFVLTCSLIAFDGRGELMPYWPVVHPIDLAQLIGCVCGLYWAVRVRSLYDSPLTRGFVRAALLIFSLAAFITLNALIARIMHHYFDVAWTERAMMNSTLVQTTASIVWSSIALILMWLGHNRVMRLLWIAGAVLLAVTLLKMFTVDLANTGNIARIISFVGVGVLILIIGYVSPMPPARDQEGTAN